MNALNHATPHEVKKAVSRFLLHSFLIEIIILRASLNDFQCFTFRVVSVGIETMANKNPPLDERAIFLALRHVFRGQNAEVRRPRLIRKLIQEHQGQGPIADLVRRHHIDVLCSAAQVLLSQEIFSSALKAKLRFPQLFGPSPTQSAEREASEAQAARNEANAIERIARIRCDGAKPKSKSSRTTQAKTHVIDSCKLREKTLRHRQMQRARRSSHPQATLMCNHCFPFTFPLTSSISS